MRANGVTLMMPSLAAMLHREYRLLTRNRTNLLLGSVPTAVYILLFATSLTNLIGTVDYRGASVPYEEFAIPAVMVSSMLAAATTAATSLFQEELGGMTIELWSYPLSRASYVAGKLIAGTALVVVQTMAALGVALLVFDIRWSPGEWLAMLVGTLLASTALGGTALLVATLLRDFQRFTVLINVLVPVLLFASPSFYPREQMSPVLVWLSTLNPATYGVGAIRDGVLFGFGTAWPSLLTLAILAVTTTTLTGRSLVARARRL